MWSATDKTFAGEEMSGGAIILIRQNQYIRRFRHAAAASPETAVYLENIGCRDSWIFQRMAARGVFVRIPDGRWYRDNAATASFIKRRLLIVIFLLTACALLALAIRLSR
jgi:hypothetical protein